MHDSDASSELAALRAQVASLTQRQELALALGVAFWDWDVPSGAVRSAGGSLGLLGHTPAETPTTSRGWNELVHPEDLPLAHAAFEPCVTGGQDQWLCTLRLRRRAGTWQWVQVGGRVVERDEAGRPLKVLGIAQDHRARKLAEDAVLRDAELLSKVSSSVICTDMDGIVTYWNPGAERLYGFTAQERVGRSIIEHYPLPERPLAERAYASVLAGQAFEGEWHGYRKDGSRVWVEARVSMFRDAEGRPAGVIGISHDISERRRAEAERRVLEQQLFQAQKLETIGTLAGGIAHDFNNILTAILVHAELGMGGALTPARVMESFGQIHQASVRAKDLVKRILTFTRPQQPERRLVSATQLLQEAAKFSRAIVPSTIELSVSIAEDAGELWVDTNQFHQVVLNLVTNAVQAMKDARGRLAFRLSRLSLSEVRRTTTGEISPGAYLLLSVLDDGEGMAEEARRRAFEPFFTTKAAGEGTGLGLSIVQGIVQSHGGGIELTSAPGVGTTFHIYWPSSDEGGFASIEPPSSSSLRGRGQRVLVVDDEQAVAFATRLALENLGYVATYVTSPEAFFAEPEERGDYELALVDHTMPRQTGLDIAARLRAEGRELPLIIASGDARHPAAESLQRLGRAAALRKPYDLEQLAETVYRLLGKRRAD